MAQTVKRLPAMRETRVRSPGREDPLAKETATLSSTLAWKIPWVENPSGLQSTGSQRVTSTFTSVKILELSETDFRTTLIKMFKTIIKIYTVMDFTSGMTSENKDEYFQPKV